MLVFSDFAGLRAVAVGHVTHDRYGDTLMAGGSAFYGAHVFRQFGAQTQLFTAVGEDFECHRDLETFETRVLMGGNTTKFSNFYPTGAARVQTIEAQAPPLLAAQFPPEFRGADVLFIAPVMGETMGPGWVEAAGARVVGVGLQGFLRRGMESYRGGRLIETHPEMFDLSVLRGVDVVFLSEEDVAQVGRSAFVASLMQAVPIVVVTAGDQGCTVYSQGDAHHVGVYPTDAIDPTGAGDSFAAAMSLGLGLGWAPRDAARLGAAAASVIVEAEGAGRASALREAWERLAQIV